MIPVPDHNTDPNWKVHPFLKQACNIMNQAIFLGRNLSCNHQTVGFQGHHKDKKRITDKKRKEMAFWQILSAQMATPLPFIFDINQRAQKL